MGLLGRFMKQPKTGFYGGQAVPAEAQPLPAAKGFFSPALDDYEGELVNGMMDDMKEYTGLVSPDDLKKKLLAKFGAKP